MTAGGEADWDVVVLGAGAAGLVSAIRAGELGARVALLERNRRPGVKILMSGGTRCNITNARGLRNSSVVSGPIDTAYDPREARGARSIQQAFGAGGAFLGPALRALSVEGTITLFENEGVATKIEGNGKVFPVSDRAVDVLDALVGRLARSGARLLVNEAVTGISPMGEGFRIETERGAHISRRVVVCVGGQSYPGCGTRGDGYGMARGFGHTIVARRAALVPLRVGEGWVRELSGLTLPDVNVRVVDRVGEVLEERREALLFAHFGLTGPAILDVSRAVARHEETASLRLVIDFLPGIATESIDRDLQERARVGRALVSNLLPSGIPRRLGEALLISAGISPERVGPELSRDERKRLVGTLKGMSLATQDTLGFAKAEVTSGGVALGEVDPETLESRLRPGLHFAGEVLDLDGLIGGYNFQAAWSTGWLAGEAAATRTLRAGSEASRRSGDR